MSSLINPEYRLIRLKRALRDLLMGHRLSADPERTGVVSLADFGKQCDALADLSGESAEGLRMQRGTESRCAAWVAEEVELAARLAALMETLPKTAGRIDLQCTVLEEAAARVNAALENEITLMEAPVRLSVSSLARGERELFEGLVSFEGRIENVPAAEIDAGLLRRVLRRAILEHRARADEGEGDRDGEQGDNPFRLSVDAQGVLRFADDGEFASQPAPVGFSRSANEPPEVKKALDMREIAPDDGLRDFLLVKAVDEALFAYLQPRLASYEIVEQARALPHKPGKRRIVRPEAVQRPIEGWDAGDAARGAEKIEARRAGPEWGKIPRGAYVLQLFLHDDPELTRDLLQLGRALRDMEKGRTVGGTEAIAERALTELLGLLG